MLCKHPRKKHLCQDHKTNTDYTARSVTLHKTPCIRVHTHFWKWVPSNYGRKREATSGCGRAWNVV